MKWFRLATSATMLGVMLATGCASPCGGGGIFHRMSMFRARRHACPCECCSNCGDGVPIAGMSPDCSDGPLLEPPPGPPFSPVPPPTGMAVPEQIPSLGMPAVPPEPGRLIPAPNGGATPLPAGPSSRVRSR